MRSNDYSLNPWRYVEIIEKEISDVDFEARMKELMCDLEKKIIEDWQRII